MPINAQMEPHHFRKSSKKQSENNTPPTIAGMRIARSVAPNTLTDRRARYR
jgi:hypothetical protein